MSMTADVNTAAIQARVTKILTDPSNEWPVIQAEPTTTEQLFKGYIGPLAAVAAIAGFIGSSIIGTLGLFRTPLVWGLIGACMTFVLALVGVYVSAIVVSKLAPTFQSTPDDRQALKLVAYAETPVWIAAVIGIIPIIGVLASVIGGLYAIYLFYLGLPVMMKTPPDKVIPYMVVAAVVIIVIMVVMWMITGAVIGAAAIGAAL